MLRPSEVWATAKKYGGISVQYGSQNIYELIFENRKQCCIVTLDKRVPGGERVPDDNIMITPMTKTICHTISDRCSAVYTLDGLESVIKKLLYKGGK